MTPAFPRKGYTRSITTAQEEKAMRLISINEAAHRLSLSRLTIRRLIRRGVIPHVRLTGRAIRVPEDAIDALAEGREVSGDRVAQ